MLRLYSITKFQRLIRWSFSYTWEAKNVFVGMRFLLETPRTTKRLKVKIDSKIRARIGLLRLNDQKNRFVLEVLFESKDPHQVTKQAWWGLELARHETKGFPHCFTTD